MNSKRKWITGLILIGVLFVGVVIGSAGTVAVLRQKIEKRPPPSFGMKHNHYADKVIGRMEKMLQLSEEQSKLIKPEVLKMAAAFDELHQATSQEMLAITETGRQAIAAYLNEDQNRRYSEHLKNRSLRFKDPRHFDKRHRSKIKNRVKHDSDARGRTPPPPPEE